MSSRSVTPTSSPSPPGGRSPNERVADISTASHPREHERGRSRRPNSPSIEIVEESIVDDNAAEATTTDGKKKRTRTLTTPYQSAVLNQLLQQSRFPTTQMREDVGRTIGLSARKVQIWFQNQRQKAKRATQSQQPTASALGPPPPQYGPYTHAQAASSTISTNTTRAAPALDPGMGGSIAGLMFSSSSGLFGGPRQPKPPVLPPLPENDASHGVARPALGAGAPGLPTLPGPYRSTSQSRSLSRSASRLSNVSTASSWSRPPSDWAAAEFDYDLPPPRLFDDDRRSTSSSGPATSFSSLPLSATYSRSGRPDTSGSGPGRASFELSSMSLGRAESPFAYRAPGVGGAPELPPITTLPPLGSPTSPLSNVNASTSRTSLPPPFTLEPMPVWDSPPLNPYTAPRPSSALVSSIASTSSTPRSMFGRSRDHRGNGDPREPAPPVRTGIFPRAPTRWDPVKAAAAERAQEDNGLESAMEVDNPGPASRQPAPLPGRTSRTP